MRILEHIDAIVRRHLTKDWTEAGRRQFVANLCVVADETSERRAVQRALDQMDTKASGTLTHISMMIAAMGVTAISEIVDHDSERFICYLTIGIYLVLAMLCLRCMSVAEIDLAAGNGELLLTRLEDDLIYRRELYSAVNSITTVLTGVVLVLIYFFYFY
ncbi:hypothetical protein SAMN05444161_3301 [Rhizobiales bacterium GAS191]|nr:hypothetical protein SAMN05519103_02427 [Rhizobiales bacterium GAS113]SEB79196.1 hypothetical protein SAMN05519104_0124 [Rhizobiales bacterium GAS188]SED48379.1 hypothetical protein SAMN05444161_3301 [Rhizobiales bacterium GAS191]